MSDSLMYPVSAAASQAGAALLRLLLQRAVVFQGRVPDLFVPFLVQIGHLFSVADDGAGMALAMARAS